MDLLKKYFPELTANQIDQFERLKETLRYWNDKINVISRKEADHIEERHILHSLSIAKFLQFSPDTELIDVGTGGGFPGLPLAVMFPKAKFTLLDSIQKKIRVVDEIASAMELHNITTRTARIENIDEKYDFIISRAVTAFPKFYNWTKKRVKKDQRNIMPNGIIYLKGGNLSQELAGFGKLVEIHEISNWYQEEWFNEKCIVYLPIL